MSLRGRPSRSIAFAATIRAWVESSPPLTPMTTLGCPMAVQPLLEPGDLDVVGLVAVESQPLRVVGDEREAVHLAAQPDVAGGWSQLEGDRAEARPCLGRGTGEPGLETPPVVVERPLPEALLPNPVEVDVGHAATRTIGEPLGLVEQLAALVEHRLAVPGQVGRRLALAGGGEGVGSRAAGAGAADEEATVLGAGHRDRAAREVRQHGRSRQGRLGARRDRDPHVLADLHVQSQPRHVGGVEDQVWPEGYVAAGHPDRRTPAVVTGREPATLVELAVGRQVGLRRDAQHLASVDDDCAVEHASAVHERGADDQDGEQICRRLDDVGDGLVHALQQGVLQEQVVGGVAGERQLREDGDGDALLVALAGLGEDGAGVGGGIRERHGDGAGGDPGESLGVRRVELHAPSLARGER